MVTRVQQSKTESLFSIQPKRTAKQWINRHRYLAAAGLFLCSSASHAISVNFSGVMDGFNAAPYTNGTSFSGSFEMAEAVSRTGNNFIDAADNFFLQIGSDQFSGNNGDIAQFSSSGDPDSDFLAVTFYAGELNGGANSVGGGPLTEVKFDWRGTLFDDPNVLAHDLTQEDFGYNRVTFEFNNSLSTAVIDTAQTVSIGSPSPVPVPVALPLFGSALGLMGVFGWRKRKQD